MQLSLLVASNWRRDCSAVRIAGSDWLVGVRQWARRRAIRLAARAKLASALSRRLAIQLAPPPLSLAGVVRLEVAAANQQLRSPIILLTQRQAHLCHLHLNSRALTMAFCARLHTLAGSLARSLTQASLARDARLTRPRALLISRRFCALFISRPSLTFGGERRTHSQSPPSRRRPTSPARPSRARPAPPIAQRLLRADDLIFTHLRDSRRRRRTLGLVTPHGLTGS